MRDDDVGARDRHAGDGVGPRPPTISQRRSALLAPAAALLSHAVQQIDPASVGLTARSAGRDNVERTLTHRLLFDEETFATYLWYDGGVAGARLDVGAAPAGRRDARRLRSRPPVVRPRRLDYARDEDSAVPSVTLPVTGGSMLVDFSAGARSARRPHRGDRGLALSVQEVIARHRQQQTRQDALLRTLSRARPHGAALPAEPHRSRLRRRHRKRVLRRGRDGRVGRAELLGQRIEVGRRPAGVSAAAGRESAVAAARAAAEPGLPLRAGRHGAGRRDRVLPRALRADDRAARRCIEARSGSTGARLPRCACRRCRRARRRRLSRTRRSTPTTWSATSEAVPIALAHRSRRRGRSC